MKNLKFIYLRIYTEDSVNLGLIKINNLINFVKKRKFKYLTFTNINSLSGSTNFYSKCLKENIKPLIFCELTIENKINIDNYNLLFLIKNKLGYLNISKILSRASIYNKNFNEIKIQPYWFKSSLRKGLILINGSCKTDIGFSIIKRKKSLYIYQLNYWKKLFKKNFFIEINRNSKNSKEIVYLNNKLILISNKFKLPILASHNVYFFKKTDFLAHEIKSCIIKNKILNVKRFEFIKENFFYKKKFMNSLFKDIPQSLKNTYYLSKICNINLDLNKIRLPQIINNKFNNNKYIIHLLKKKLKKKKINNNIYIKRLLNECNVIIKIGLSDYFLLIHNLINWSKKKFIIKGPGRGSCSASLISYLLEITDIDPIKYNLIFERFLNIERLSIPDFDIDFCNNKKDIIIKYIKIKYGINKVFQISTVNKITIKNSIRDIGRVLNYNYRFINNISKSINYKNYNYKKLLKNNFDLKSLFKKCIKLEGLKKAKGIHAGGILLLLNNFFYNFYIIDSNNILATSYDKDNLEILGVVKIDFLGLTTLTVINNIKRLNNYNEYNLNNKLCYFYFKKGVTFSIFQLEGVGVKNALIKFKPIKFNNIICLISLYRPGPISLIKNFIERKLGYKKTYYIDKKVKKLLKETYGLVIYQEQVIFITKIISNFSLTRADILRLAMSKKNVYKMNDERGNFCNYSKLNKFSIKKSNIIFNLLEKFSDYGFNKSHATAYSYISYYMMHLKLFYKLEFYTANMSLNVDNQFKINSLLSECKKNNIIILPININYSEYNFKSYRNLNNYIRMGFKSIKGLGDNTIYEIINLRKINKFISFLDFYKKVSTNINFKILETLIVSGAFDFFNYNKSELIYNLIDIFNDYNLKNKITYVKPIFNKKKKIINYYWNFYTMVLEEYVSFKFNYFNNLCFLFYDRLNDILDFNDYYFYGILLKKYKKDLFKSYIFLNLINEEYFYQVKIKNKFFYRKKKILKIWEFLILKCSFFKKFYYIKRILNIRNFLYMHKKWLELDWEWLEEDEIDLIE